MKAIDRINAISDSMAESHSVRIDAEEVNGGYLLTLRNVSDRRVMAPWFTVDWKMNRAGFEPRVVSVGGVEKTVYYSTRKGEV